MLRTESPPYRRFIGLALAVALLSSFLLLGGAAASPASASSQAPTVVMVPRPDYGGSILTDPDGWTLYTWDGDAPAESWCYDDCAGVWMPYTIEGELVSPDDLPVSLGLIDRGDGTWQVTLDNFPLYYFARDTQPGDVAGDGVVAFGARWYVNAFTPPTPEIVFVPQPAPPVQPAPVLPPPAPPVAPAPPVVAMPVATTVPVRNVAVAIAEFEFRPANINIQVGDTVVWTNNGRLAHTATSDTGVWDAGRLNPGQNYSHTFSSAGTFPYHCAIHQNMRGVIVVGTASGPVGQFQPGMQPGMPWDDTPFFGQQPGFGQPPFPQVGFPPQGQLQQTSIATAQGNGSVALTWAPIQNALSYRVYGTLASSPLNLTVLHTVNQGLGGAPVGQALISGLTPGATYHFQVRAVDANGVENIVPSASMGTAPPPLPGGGVLTVTSTTGTTVSLDWPQLPGASTYRVMQSTSPGGPWTLATAGTVSTTSALVTGLAPNTNYFFQIAPVDQLGQLGPPTNTVSASTGF